MSDTLTREEVAQLRTQIARLTEERDKARADFQWMVDHAADQRLDGYRELGQRAAAAENARDEARARVGEVSRDNDRLRSVLFAYRAANYRLRALLEEARNMIVANRLVLGERQGPREVSRLTTRIDAEVATGGPDMPAWDEGEGEEPGRRAAVFGLISAERERQASLWGPGPMPQGRELAILMEEVGEVARALQGDGDLRDELVQVAAVCVRWLEAEGER